MNSRGPRAQIREKGPVLPCAHGPRAHSNEFFDSGSGTTALGLKMRDPGLMGHWPRGPNPWLPRHMSQWARYMSVALFNRWCGPDNTWCKWRQGIHVKGPGCSPYFVKLGTHGASDVHRSTRNTKDATAPPRKGPMFPGACARSHGSLVFKPRARGPEPKPGRKKHDFTVRP